MAQQPYDDRGRRVSKACPNPDCDGTLQPESVRDLQSGKLIGKTLWRCNGLVDPNDPDKELQACEFSHMDGDPYTATPEQFIALAAATCRCHPGR